MNEQATVPDPADDPEDVVALLMRQHGDIRNLFDEVEQSTGDQRKDAFARLVRLLAVHETAEEEVVHPLARTAYDGAGKVIDKRLEEENEAKQLLAGLEDTDTDDPEFLPKLLELRMKVMEHARAEERYEFSHIRRTVSPQQRAAMAQAVKTAEALAPTHPHPGVESATSNLLLGPFAAIVDRARDAIRSARSR